MAAEIRTDVNVRLDVAVYVQSWDVTDPTSSATDPERRPLTPSGVQPRLTVCAVELKRRLAERQRRA